MKKRVIVGIATALLVFLAGCTGAPPESTVASSTPVLISDPTTMLTSIYGMVSQAGTEEGFYEWKTNASGSSALTYIDYASKQKIYLCSQPNCHHSDAGCPAWFNGPAGFIFTSANEEYLFCIQQNSVDAKANEQLWRLEKDGSNRTLLLELKGSQSFCDAVAGNSENLYVAAMDYNGVKELLEINMNNGSTRPLLKYSSSDWLYGAFDDQLVILYYDFTDYSNGTFTYTTYSLTTNEQKDLYQYSYSDNGDPAQGRIARTNENFLYVISPKEGALSDVTKIDMRTGSETILCTSLPYYNVDTTFVHAFEDDHMIVSANDASDPENIKNHIFGVDCTTGKLIELPQRVLEGTTEHLVPIMATLDTQLLVISEYKPGEITMYGTDGLPYTTTMNQPVYSLIDRGDFWAGETTYQPIEDLT